jgi:hypothetical protein
MLDGYHFDEKSYPINRTVQPAAQETRRSNARRACSLIFRIAKFVTPTPPAGPRQRRAPSPPPHPPEHPHDKHDSPPLLAPTSSRPVMGDVIEAAPRKVTGAVTPPPDP